jgi:hypothetical protein
MIPIKDPDYPSRNRISMTEEESKTVGNLTSYVNGKSIQISYFLKIFIKHDSMLEMGEGQCL